MAKILFWNVDTQVDFMDENGLLAVPEAKSIRKNLKEITDFAQTRHIQVVNTADWHNEQTKEIADTPDFVTTFPKHCMEYSHGASYISETQPRTPFVVLDWSQKYSREMIETMSGMQNIVVRKDMFDVFEGNPYTTQLVAAIAPTEVYVYGVATNVCVHFAVEGLLRMGISVSVVEDAIKALPNIPSPIAAWKRNGAKIIERKQLWTL